MPIPLGILAAAGFRAAGGSYELIETINISGTSTTSVTFSNLNNYNTTYQHLQIRGVFKTSTGTGFNTNYRLRFNGDTGNNYATHSLYETDGGVKSEAQTSQNAINMWAINPNGVSAGYQAFVMDILDPYEAKNKTVRSLDGAIQTTTNYQKFIQLRSGLWNSTAQVQSINFSLSVDAFGDLSRFSIYGIKGS